MDLLPHVDRRSTSLGEGEQGARRRRGAGSEEEKRSRGRGGEEEQGARRTRGAGGEEEKRRNSLLEQLLISALREEKVFWVLSLRALSEAGPVGGGLCLPAAAEGRRLRWGGGAWAGRPSWERERARLSSAASCS